MGILNDKVALVTGAGGGIGRGIALALAKEGASVAVIDIKGDGAKETALLVEQQGGQAMAVTCDITQSANVNAAVKTVVDRFGGVNILVNNAAASRPGPLELATDEDIELAYKTGPMASMYFMRACFPYLKGGYGRVINLRSGSEMVGMKYFSTYIGAKGAIAGLSRVAAKEWGAHGITVNCVAPGVMTPAAEAHFKAHPEALKAVLGQLAIPRFGDAEADIGRTIVFLASPDASYVTGSTLSVDGAGAFYS